MRVCRRHSLCCCLSPPLVLFEAPSPLLLSGSNTVDPHRLVRKDFSSMRCPTGADHWACSCWSPGKSLLSRQTTDDRMFVNNHRRSGSESAVGCGAERVRSSLWQETHDPGTEESLGSTYAPREWRGIRWGHDGVDCRIRGTSESNYDLR